MSSTRVKHLEALCLVAQCKTMDTKELTTSKFNRLPKVVSVDNQFQWVLKPKYKLLCHPIKKSRKEEGDKSSICKESETKSLKTMQSNSSNQHQYSKIKIL